MNKIITVIVFGADYNHTFKWNSVEELHEAIGTNKGLPKKDDVVIEAYVDDNIVVLNETWENTLEKLKLILMY